MISPQVVEQAKLDAWKVSETLLDIVRKMFSSVGGTKIIEDQFKVGRDIEHKGGNQNFRMKPDRFFDKLITSGHTHKLYNFEPLPWNACVAPRGEKDNDCAALFKTSIKQASPVLRECVGTNQNPPWYSPAASNQCQCDVDMELALYCEANNCWERGQYAWLCTLMKDHGMLVQHVKAGPLAGRWMFCVGDMQNVAALLWPSLEVQLGDQVCYCLDPAYMSGVFPLGFVLDLSEWRAMGVEWLSPMGVACKAAALGVAPPPHGCIAVPTHEPRGLLQAAASRCFGEAPKTLLLSLAKYIGAPFSPDDTLYARLEKLLHFVLPDAGPDAIMEIMTLRVHRSSVLEQYLASGAADEVLNKDDKKEVDRISAKASNAQIERASYAKAIKAAGVKLRLAKQSATPGSKKRKRNSATGAPSRYGPVNVHGTITATEIGSCLPIGYRCWHDRYNSRWQLFQGQHRVRNASFSTYGMAGAAQQIIRAAWNLHEALGGEPMPFTFEEVGLGDSGSSPSRLRPPDAEAAA